MRRAAIAALVLGLPFTAAAEPFKHDVIWGKAPARAPGTKAFTSVSHTLYLNDCMPDGCTVRPGFDDSLTGHSSIAESIVTLDAWSYGSAQWDALVQCVQETFAPFDIQVVTADPGASTDHFEVMVGGRALQLNSQLQGAGGVAPFVVCDGQLENNVISFVFSGEGGNLNYWCGAVAQEASHVWGLDHEMNSKDPMTYMDLGSHKVFQDADVSCGEFQNRDCYCGNPTQNSFQYLTDTFGPANLTPGTVTITAPADGAWVKPGFAVRATVDSQLTIVGGALSIDGAAVGAASPGDTLSFTAPTALAGGSHTVTVAATDAGRTFSSSVAVNVVGSCASGEACADGTLCLNGSCYPGAEVAGGLGATCATNEECITGACFQSGSSMLCSGSCDAGHTCPSGFSCLGDGADAVCWPSSSDGGCNTSGSGAAGLMLFGVGAMVVGLRRKRR